MSLKKVLTALESNKTDCVFNYAIPDLWNTFGYQEAKQIRSGELLVNPFHFYQSLIKETILSNRDESQDYSKSLSSLSKKRKPKKYIGGDWIKDSIVYSTMIRTSAAWDHDRSGALEDENIYHMRETGSFVKMLALLPYLKDMGINVIYLLPISKFSLKDKKGDLGSPYGVSSFNKLDPNLKDSLTGDHTTVEEEFKAFVEACHILGMRVMIDIIPRTNAVENDLINDHPDWFYWIKSSNYEYYQAPRIKSLGFVPPAPEHMEDVYQDPDTYRHINMFEYDPRTQDPKRFEKIKNSEHITDAIEQEFGLKIAPAFSDGINDPQPPWTDVTFFRMYLDFPVETRGYLDTTERAPYILFDTIKSNLFKGNLPNMALWERLADIIPQFQRDFGIDGARIDMGHALPIELLNMIMEKARKNDSDFCFIAEELQSENAQKAADAGYNMIIGDGFMKESRVWNGELKQFIFNSKELPIPCFACAETHDTPRIAAREGRESIAKLVTVLNYFAPTLIPFINSGQEIFETQPMNTGLDSTEDGAYQLMPDDPYYGKLALFDKYQFHYMYNKRWDLYNILKFVYPIRSSWLTQIKDKKSLMVLNGSYNPNSFIAFAYFKKNKSNKKNLLIILANADTYNEIRTHVNIYDLREKSKNIETKGSLLFSTHEEPRVFTQFYDFANLDIHLGPGEIKIVEL
jgi:starch synthase (maltosyl-transferring)